MSKSRYRPRGRRSPSPGFLRYDVNKPRRQEFRMYVIKVLKVQDPDALLEPNERKPKNYWD